MIFPSLQDISEYRRRLPTTDLYFRNPLRHLIRHEPKAAGLPPIRSVAPNVYSIGATGIISRYGSPRDVDRLHRLGASRIVYIADDDFAAGAADPLLPAPYRARLASFVRDAWPALKAAADIVIVPSAPLAEIYGAKARIVPTAWHLPPAATENFVREGRIKIVHLGTGSHRSDLAPIAGELAKLLGAWPNARLTLFAGAEAPAELKGHRQVRSRRPMPWWRYKHVLPRLRFHLAIYPLRDSAFNRARSANKLFEQALLGAAALMSPNPALRNAAGADLADLFVDGGPDEWGRRIEMDLADPDAARDRAERTRAHILAADPLGEAAGRWLDILAGET